MAQEQLIIEGNLVTKRVYTDEYTVPLNELLPDLTSYIPLELGHIPEGLKYIIVKPDDNMVISTTVVMQRNPGLTRVNYKPVRIEVAGEHRSFQLSMPFTFIWAQATGTKQLGARGETMLWSLKKWGFMFSRTPWDGVATPVVNGMLPNCYPDTRVCFGTNSIRSDQPFGKYLDSMVNLFWTSGFNTDLTHPLAYPGDTQLKAMEAWEKASLEDANVWSTWKEVWSRERPFASWVEAVAKVKWEDPVPDAVGEHINPMRTVPTFTNIERWHDELSATQRARLSAVVNRVTE